MTYPARVKLAPIAGVLLLVFALVLGGCVIESQEQIFSRSDIVKVDKEKAQKMGFTRIKGGKTYFYQDPKENDECAEVGFVPLDKRKRLYIATNFSKTCMDERDHYFYVLVDFEDEKFKFFANKNQEDTAAVRELAKKRGVRLLYDDDKDRYVSVEKVSKETMKTFFLAFADSAYVNSSGD